MIQAYSENNTNYSLNGDIVLCPSEAYVECELNGSWTATIVHPIDDEGRWRYLTEEAVVSLPSWNGTQLFRIKQRAKDAYSVTCVAYPIFFDCASECFIESKTLTDKTCEQALAAVLSNKYSVESDIAGKCSANFEYINAMEAINGGDDSIAGIWKAELMFDNFKVIANARIGADNGLEMRYGKNIRNITEDVDMSSVVTRIYPQAYNGIKMTATSATDNKTYVDSEIASSYPTIKAATMTFDNVKFLMDMSDEDFTDPKVVRCETQDDINEALRTECQNAFEAGSDKPTVNISIDGVFELSKYQGYEQFSQPVELGDTVHLIHDKLGIRTDARIVSIKYDSLRERTESVQIGSLNDDYFRNSFTAISSTAERLDKVEQAGVKQRHYFWHDTDGAHVSTTERDVTHSKNVLIDSEGMQVRNGYEVLSRFGANEIELGANSKETIIKLCKDEIEISVDSTTIVPTALINSNGDLLLGANDMIGIVGNNRFEVYSDNFDFQGQSETGEFTVFGGKEILLSADTIVLMGRIKTQSNQTFTGTKTISGVTLEFDNGLLVQ